MKQWDTITGKYVDQDGTTYAVEFHNQALPPKKRGQVMRFVAFIDTVDRVVYVNPSSVCYVNRQIRDDGVDSSWITFQNEEISVLGSPDEVVKALEDGMA